MEAQEHQASAPRCFFLATTQQETKANAQTDEGFPRHHCLSGEGVNSKKLVALAELTGRGQGKVLRLLLKQAVVAEQPDIRLTEPLPSALPAEEAAHVG